MVSGSRFTLYYDGAIITDGVPHSEVRWTVGEVRAKRCSTDKRGFARPGGQPNIR